jgi:hypothetical protein
MLEKEKIISLQQKNLRNIFIVEKLLLFPYIVYSTYIAAPVSYKDIFNGIFTCVLSMSSCCWSQFINTVLSIL